MRLGVSRQQTYKVDHRSYHFTLLSTVSSGHTSEHSYQFGTTPASDLRSPVCVPVSAWPETYARVGGLTYSLRIRRARHCASVRARSTTPESRCLEKIWRHPKSLVDGIHFILSACSTTSWISSCFQEAKIRPFRHFQSRLELRQDRVYCRALMHCERTLAATMAGLPNTT